MAGFTISRPFTLETQEVRQTARLLADKLCSEHPVKAHWVSEDEIVLSGMGVNGKVSISDNTLIIQVTLGLLTRVFEDRMKREIEHYLDKYLS